MNDTAPTIKVGDLIEHKLMPGFPMEVLEIAPCPQTPPLPGHPEAHNSYKVIDPEGNEDWLCAHDVRRVG